jgi:YggT family protein
MSVIIFIVDSVLQYLLVTAFLLRLVLPLARANMRNQLAQAVIRVTNPLVLPLRRVLPPIGRVDTASVVALLAVQFATTALVLLLSGFDLSNFVVLIKRALFSLLEMSLQFYRVSMFIYVVLGWVAPTARSPASDVLEALCEPPLRWVRKVIPPIAQLDLSPFFVLIGISALLMLLPMLFS